MTFLNVSIIRNFCRSYEHFLFPTLEEKVRKRYKFKNLPKIKELEQRSVIMFVNTNNAVDNPEPLQPNMIEIGGLQIAEPKPLSSVRSYFLFELD